MKPLPKQVYTAEYKIQAIEHAKAQGTSAAARALGLRPQTLGNWVRAAAAGKAIAAGATPVSPEAMELSRLRTENAHLKMHVDILKKAAAYFAKDAL